jgi:hypothetical protein
MSRPGLRTLGLPANSRETGEPLFITVPPAALDSVVCLRARRLRRSDGRSPAVIPKCAGGFAALPKASRVLTPSQEPRMIAGYARNPLGSRTAVPVENA